MHCHADGVADADTDAGAVSLPIVGTDAGAFERPALQCHDPGER